ncbi:MAG TPA: DUF1003 domain-containing protein [Blastocatellia bacterium]|nr:DUF1003 domain-containing protein [Blastocatellia bacterium]
MADVQSLQTVRLFSAMDEQELTDLSQHLDLVTFEPNTVIFKAGDEPDSMYMIKNGQVRISIRSFDGKEEAVLSTLESGSMFGEMGVLDRKPRSATATVVGKAQIYKLSTEDFHNFLAAHPHAALDVLSIMASRLRETDEIMARRVSRNVNTEIEQHMTYGDRLADSIASFGGSWTFIILFCFILAAWMTLNGLAIFKAIHFDEFPYMFLNLALSCIAALQAPVIMMSQNRASEKDRLHAELDFQVNLKSELALAQLNYKMDRLHEQEMQKLIGAQQEHILMLKEMLDIARNSNGQPK